MSDYPESKYKPIYSLPTHTIVSPFRLFFVRLLGKKHESLSFPWYMQAYFYKGKYYITRLENVAND